MNGELSDVQAGFRKDIPKKKKKYIVTRDQIADIHWIIEKARELQKNIYFAWTSILIDSAKALNSDRDGNTRLPDLPLKKPYAGQLEPDMEQQTGSK